MIFFDVILWNFIGFWFVYRFDSGILIDDFFCFGNSVLGCIFSCDIISVRGGIFACDGISPRGGRDAINRVSTHARVKPSPSIKPIGDRWLIINIYVFDFALQQNFPIWHRRIVWVFPPNIFRPINRFNLGNLKDDFFGLWNSVRGGRDAINRVSTYVRVKPSPSIKPIGVRRLIINIYVYDFALQQNFLIRNRGIVWGFPTNIFPTINRFNLIE